MSLGLGIGISRQGGPLNPDGLSLDLAFALDKTLTARKGPTPTFTRASTATFVGSNGLIQSAANNIPRFDHDPVTLACRGLLIEEQRENKNLRSQEIDDALYGKFNSSVTANVTVSPDGLTNADKIIENAGNAFHSIFLQTAIALTPGQTFTRSAFLKANGRNFAVLQITDGTAFRAFFNLTTGAIGTVSAGITAAISDFGNGWYRCSITRIFTGATSNALPIELALADNNASYTGDGTSGVFAWGLQFELGAFPTSYIPTKAAALTRSADVCSITGANFTSFYNQSEGTLVTGYSSFTNSQVLPSKRGITMSDGTTANRVAVANIPSDFTLPGLSMIFFAISGGASVAVLGKTGLDTTTLNTISGAYKVDDFASSTNGSAVVTDTSGAVPVGINKIDIGNQLSSDFLNGHIARIQYFKKRLPNAKLQTLTT